MKRYALHFVALLSAALMLLLLSMWFTSSGTVRNVHWQPPKARNTDFAAVLPALPGVASADISQFVAMLDRPLFSTTRRPPPPPPPPEAAAPVDNLSTARLSGIFEGAGGGGIIINIAGKDQRVRLKEALDGWSLQSIAGRNVTFARSGQTRVLTLPRAALTTYTGAAPQTSPAAPLQPYSSLAPNSSPTPASSMAAPLPQQQQQQAPPKASFGGSR